MIYEYKCTKCGTITEVEHKMMEKPKIKCIKCRNPCVKVITGGSGFILDGSGWGKDNYDKGKKEKKKETT
jgi:putative FmdB family regulatory protein